MNMNEHTIPGVTGHAGRPVRPGPRRRSRVGRLALASLLPAALLAAGCSAGAPSALPSSSASSAKPSALAYAQCMRSHGVTNFPDPSSNGRIAITQGDGVNINSPQFRSAQDACKSLQPGALTPTQQAQQAASARKYAKCMRSHGVPKFPDPNSQGGFEIQPGAGIDPNSPQYQSANKTCHHFLPGLQGGQTVTNGAP